jgi:hypothetical protein
MWSLLSSDYSISGTFNKQILVITIAMIPIIGVIAWYSTVTYGLIGAIAYLGFAIPFIFQKLGHMKQHNELFGPNQKWKDDPFTKSLQGDFDLK